MQQLRTRAGSNQEVVFGEVKSEDWNRLGWKCSKQRPSKNSNKHAYVHVEDINNNKSFTETFQHEKLSEAGTKQFWQH